MPQFDKITFFNQIFWLILIFLVFYTVLLRNYLPKISSILKVRNKKLSKGARLVGDILSENSTIFRESNQLASIFLLYNSVRLDKHKDSDLSAIDSFSKTIRLTSNSVNNYYGSYSRIAVKKVLSDF